MNDDINVERGIMLVIGELRILVERYKEELKKKEELISVLKNDYAQAINDLNKK